MNKLCNSRAKLTKEKINKALMYLLTHKSFNEIYVKDICTIACINRSSFYAHYQDINDLMIKTEQQLSKEISKIFTDISVISNECFVKMFEFIKNNKEFYTAYLTKHSDSFMGQVDFMNFYDKYKGKGYKIGISENALMYHMAFFGAGLSAICKIWLNTGLKETPQQMADIIYNEYNKTN